MTDPFHKSIGEGEFLTVRIGGAPGVEERLLLIGRPNGESVRVREWRSSTMITEGEDYDVDPHELLESIEQAFAARLQVSEDLYTIRRWLEVGA
jgi:hypothetical protein